MTVIVATLGKACEKQLASLIQNGMGIARLNFSHETADVHLGRLRALRKADNRLGTETLVMVDLQGPEVRLVLEKEKKVEKGGMVFLSEKMLTMPDFLQKVIVGSRLLIDDGLVELEVREKRNGGVVCEVLADGTLKPRKTVACEWVTMDGSAIVQEDRRTIALVAKNVDWIAVSHVKTAGDMEEARALADCRVIAKIENAVAVRNIREIIQASDGIMVARGDLGVNVPLQLLPGIQEQIVGLCRQVGIFSVVATQMMESMIAYPRPSRAEITDVWNAVRQGANGVMLSGETAVGAHPAEAVGWMRKICDAAEKQAGSQEVEELLH